MMDIMFHCEDLFVCFFKAPLKSEGKGRNRSFERSGWTYLAKETKIKMMSFTVTHNPLVVVLRSNSAPSEVNRLMHFSFKVSKIKLQTIKFNGTNILQFLVLIIYLVILHISAFLPLYPLHVL